MEEECEHFQRETDKLKTLNSKLKKKKTTKKKEKEYENMIEILTQENNEMR